MKVDFSQLTDTQRTRVLQHIQDFKNDPKLMAGRDKDILERIEKEIRNGGSINDEVDWYRLALFIANTSTDEEPWRRYIHSLGLPPDLA